MASSMVVPPADGGLCTLTPQDCDLLEDTATGATYLCGSTLQDMLLFFIVGWQWVGGLGGC